MQTQRVSRQYTRSNRGNANETCTNDDGVGRERRDGKRRMFVSTEQGSLIWGGGSAPHFPTASPPFQPRYTGREGKNHTTRAREKQEEVSGLLHTVNALLDARFEASSNIRQHCTTSYFYSHHHIIYLLPHLHLWTTHPSYVPYRRSTIFAERAKHSRHTDDTNTNLPVSA